MIAQGVPEALALTAFPEDENLVDIVTTGLEGGYPWFVIDLYRWHSNDGSAASPWAIVSEGCDCWEGAACEELSSDEPDEDHDYLLRKFPLTIETLRTGLERYVAYWLEAGRSPRQVLDALDDMDLNDADAVLQFAVFGELRYG